MSLRSVIASAVVSGTVRDAARLTAAARRRATGARPTLRYFHQSDDPYSHLTAQALLAMRDRYAVTIEVFLAPPPRNDAAPERERLEAWSRRDAARLARAHGLDFPADAAPPAASAVTAAQSALAAGLSEPDVLERAVVIGDALWSGGALPAGAPPAAALAQGENRRRALGHYLGGVIHYEGEWFWGVDRLPYLEERLSPFREEGQPPITSFKAEGEQPAPNAPVTVDFFFSFRSPYTYLAAERLGRLCDRYRATLRHRFILPMVMRGLPVPRDKSLYIIRDCKREADRLGLPFGRIVDPVGPGAERSLAVAHAAVPLGRARAFTESALRGAWAEGVDLASDTGLLHVAERAGVDADTVRAAIADEGWRAVAEANRAALFALGLWGAPTMRVAGKPAHWGQDRLWAVEADLLAIAEGTPS